MENKPTKESELKKAEEALGKEHNLNQISFYEGYIKGLKFEPTKECKHEELLGADYTEDCSVKLFGYRDKKGVTHITREEVSSPKIDSILKEADKELDKKANEWESNMKDPFGMDGGISNDWNEVKDFLHSQITKAYKAGYKERFIKEDATGKWGEDYKERMWDTWEREIKQQTIKQIEEWADKNIVKNLSGNVHLVIYEDLKKFLSKL